MESVQFFSLKIIFDACGNEKVFPKLDAVKKFFFLFFFASSNFAFCRPITYNYSLINNLKQRTKKK